jgi:hypothetical protein
MKDRLFSCYFFNISHSAASPVYSCIYDFRREKLAVAIENDNYIKERLPLIYILQFNSIISSSKVLHPRNILK